MKTFKPKNLMNFDKMIALFNKNTVTILLFTFFINTINAQLVHPGGWHTQEDLTLIRTQIAAEEEPWITGWNAARNEGVNASFTTNPSQLITSNGAMHTAGMGAWVLTMKWVATGDRSYSSAAIDVIDTWVDVVRDFDVYGPTLTLSTGAGAMAQAAEILEHAFNGEAGWSQTDADAAKVWFKEIIYDRWTNTGGFRSTNWGTSALGGNMSMAIFMNDEDEYNYQVDAYRFGYQDTDDGCTALTDYIFSSSGQAQESGRDQAHVQGGIAHLTEAALCMWNQGDTDMVYRENNRLLAGVEYHARYNLGYNDLPFTTDVYNPCDLPLIPRWSFALSEDERGNFSPVYWMSAKLFSKAGLSYPNTEEVIDSPGYTPEVNNFAHPGLGTFTFVPTSSEEIVSTFTPDPSKTYYIDSSVHNLRLASTGESEDAYTTSTGNTGDNEKWQFVAKGNGSWHVQRAAGGNLSRLRTDGTENADMQSASTNSGTYTYFDMESTGSGNTYFFTLPDGPSGNTRLQIDPDGNVKMMPSSYDGSWESFTITEAGFVSGGGSTVVHMTKRNATGFAIDGGNGGSDFQEVYLWEENDGNANQQWIEIDRGNGFYSYQKQGTDYCIDGAGGGTNGQETYLYTCGENNYNQHWQKVATAGGTYRLEKRNSPAYSLDGNRGGENEQAVYLWESDSDNQNQQWYITPIGTSAKAIDTIDTEEVVVYPNPVVSTTSITGAADSTLHLYDLTGRLLLTQEILSESETIDLSNFSAGIYYCQINGNQSIDVIKIIKE